MSASEVYESNTTDVVLDYTIMASSTRYCVEDAFVQEGFARIRASPSCIKDIDIWFLMSIFTVMKGFAVILATHFVVRFVKLLKNNLEIPKKNIIFAASKRN